MERSRSLKTKCGTELPLLNLKGKDYLQVAYRLVWFREECKHWSIETDLVQHTDEFSVSKAIIRDETGRIIASAYQREDKRDFQDHLAKSGTAAVGRALALCGYGTQFAPELDEGERIVDSPLQMNKAPTGPMTKAEALAYVFPLGKHKNRTVSSLPLDEALSYLSWVVSQPDKDGVKHPFKTTCEELLDVLGG